MKIKTKLIVSSTVLLAGVAAMAATGLLLVKGIETHVHGLTDETVPLYTDVLRLRYTVQDMASDFFELGKAQDLAQLEQVSNKIVANIQTAESISDDLRRHGQLQAPRYHAAFEREFQRMRVAVRKRLENEAYYKAQATEMRQLLAQIKAAAKGARGNIRLVDSQAQATAAEVQLQSQRLNQNARYLTDLRQSIYDMQIALAETQAVKSRFRIAPLRERLAAAVAHLAGTSERDISPSQLTLRAKLLATTRQLLDPGAGLLALRAGLLAEGGASAGAAGGLPCSQGTNQHRPGHRPPAPGRRTRSHRIATGDRARPAGAGQPLHAHLGPHRGCQRRNQPGRRRHQHRRGRGHARHGRRRRHATGPRYRPAHQRPAARHGHHANLAAKHRPAGLAGRNAHRQHLPRSGGALGTAAGASQGQRARQSGGAGRGHRSCARLRTRTGRLFRAASGAHHRPATGGGGHGGMACGMPSC